MCSVSAAMLTPSSVFAVLGFKKQLYWALDYDETLICSYNRIIKIINDCSTGKNAIFSGNSTTALQCGTENVRTFCMLVMRSDIEEKEGETAIQNTMTSEADWTRITGKPIARCLSLMTIFFASTTRTILSSATGQRTTTLCRSLSTSNQWSMLFCRG